MSFKKATMAGSIAAVSLIALVIALFATGCYGDAPVPLGSSSPGSSSALPSASASPSVSLPLESSNAAASPSSSAGTDADTLVYENGDYGFTLTLPTNWSGYTVIQGEWAAYSGSTANDVPLTGPIVTIRNPKWTEGTPCQDVPIAVLTYAQWYDVRDGKLSVGESAPNSVPEPLGYNASYVFVTPTRWDFGSSEGISEAHDILDTLNAVTSLSEAEKMVSNLLGSQYSSLAFTDEETVTEGSGKLYTFTVQQNKDGQTAAVGEYKVACNNGTIYVKSTDGYVLADPSFNPSR